MPHKFAIGQIVDFNSKVMPSTKPLGPFEIVRLLPSDRADDTSYRIKSKTELFERSAKEHELVSVDSPSAEPSAGLTQWVGPNVAVRLQPLRPARPR